MFCPSFVRGQNPPCSSRVRITAVLERFPLIPRVEDLAGRAALELADDAVLGHEVDEPGCAAVADTERALEQRARTAALADDDFDGRLVQVVALLEGRTAVLAAGSAADLHLHQFAAKLGRIPLQVLTDAVDLGVRD